MKEPEEIISIVGEKFAITSEQMKGKSRKFEIVLARHIAMYFMSIECYMSLKMIGKTLGNRDHSTVMHGIKRIEDDYYQIVSFRKSFDKLHFKITGKEFDGEFIERGRSGKLLKERDSDQLRIQVYQLLHRGEPLMKICRDLNVQLSTVYLFKKDYLVKIQQAS